MEEVSEDSLKDFMSDMKNKFEEFEHRQDQRMMSLENIVKDLAVQITGLRSTVDFISKQYDGLKIKVETLETERKNNLANIQSLEEKVENMERTQRLTSIEIRNIPVQKNETKTELLMIVANICKVANAPIQNSDVRDIFRTSANPTNKPIIVDFCRVVVKEKFLGCIKTYNKMHSENKLNTKSLRIDGPLKPVFVSENLTQKIKRLFYLSRDFSKSNNFRYCWTAHGKVYIRKTDGAPLLRINSEADLNKLRVDQ